jgi:dipeptidyl aminopeptidase/acylaminoacyl peptidase
MLKESRRRWTDYYVLGDFIGSGAHVREGSPAFNAARMQVPVLLLHGDEDRNVPIEQGRRMDEALRASSAPHELVVYPGLDHSLSDSAARADLLRRSDTFLRKILMP